MITTEPVALTSSTPREHSEMATPLCRHPYAPNATASGDRLVRAGHVPAGIDRTRARRNMPPALYTKSSVHRAGQLVLRSVQWTLLDIWGGLRSPSQLSEYITSLSTLLNAHRQNQNCRPIIGPNGVTALGFGSPTSVRPADPVCRHSPCPLLLTLEQPTSSGISTPS